MQELTIIDLDALGELWLPWYADRGNRKRVIEDLYADFARAMALHVAETRDPDSAVLSYPHPDPAHPGWTHAERIDHHADRLGRFESVALVARAWETPEGPVLRDLCHRACALYRLDPPSWEVVLWVEEPPAGTVDAMPGLRPL